MDNIFRLQWVRHFTAKKTEVFMTQRIRCDWAGNDALYQQYHDEEWGKPSYDDRHLFEMLLLEGAQAGLNWITLNWMFENAVRHGLPIDPAAVAGNRRFQGKGGAAFLDACAAFDEGEHGCRRELLADGADLINGLSGR